MAFEPRTSIAQIMASSMGKFPSVAGSLARGYQQGLANKQAREQGERQERVAQRQEKQMDAAEQQRRLEKIGGQVSAISMLPEDQQPMAWAEFRKSAINEYGKDPGEYSMENMTQVMGESTIGMNRLIANQKHQQEQSTFGKPTEMMQNGQRVFVERNPAGESRQVEGYNAPPPKAADAPSSIREWNQFNAMSPQQQEQYLTMKRANRLYDIGSGFLPVSQTTNQPTPGVSPIAKEIPPEQEPEFKGQQAEATASGSAVGTAQGAATAKLTEMNARMPRMEQVVTELSELGKKATYTYAGQAVDAAARQFGMDTPEGAVARTEYIAKVDNEILPLLRLTFGAQFTVEEGKALRVTLGDPNKSPAEKDAVLKAFIENKRAQIEVQARMVGGEAQPAPTDTTNYGPRATPAGGGFKFLGFE